MSRLTIARRLKALRKDSGMTQFQVAQSVNISNTTLSQYESGKRLPCFDTLCDLANLFDVSTDYLLGMTDRAAPGEGVFAEEEIAALIKLKRIDPVLFSSMLSATSLPQTEREVFSGLAKVYVGYIAK